MEFETILTEERDGVFIITFNRLEARNAINNLMTKELSDALDYWDKNDELRACVLTNNGHVFCAGSDLKELAEDAWEMPEGREKWGFAACTKRYFDKPLIAAVRGKALGGGVEIVAACDLAVASDESIFGLPEPRVGLHCRWWWHASSPCSADSDEVRYGAAAGSRAYLGTKSQ